MSTTKVAFNSVRGPTDAWTDLSLGSSQFGIRPAVFIQSTVLETYREIHPSLGLNTVGVILSLLAAHLAANPRVSQHDYVTVCLRRDKDGLPTEVRLQVEFQHSGRNNLICLRLAGDSI
jgi:hypothetical protein